MLGCCGEAEQFLHADRHGRPLLGLIVDRHRRAGRRGEMRRRLGIEALAQIPRQQGVERSGQIVGADLRERGFVHEERRQPFRCGLCERGIGQVGPLVTLGAAQKRNAIAQLQLRLAPRQLADAERGNAGREQSCGLGIGRDRFDLLGKRDGAQPARAPRAQRRRAGIETDGIAVFDLTREARFDFGKRDRRGQNDTARRRATGQFRHRQKRFARQRRCRIDIAAAAIGQQKGASAAAAAFGDAVGISQREQRTDANARHPRLCRRPCRPTVLPWRARPARGPNGRGGIDRDDGADRDHRRPIHAR